MFEKWDIIYSPKFPETVKCSKCRRHFSILYSACDYCTFANLITNIVAKPRPIILWLDQGNWFNSMAFAIPLSKTNIFEDRGNEIVKLEEYTFLHRDSSYRVPMRAMICQATRVDGNVFSSQKLIGKVSDITLQNKIQNKLFSWIFG